MKMLVCTDGSKQSMKAAAEAAKIAGGCKADQVDIINVYAIEYLGEAYSMSQIDHYRIMQEIREEEGAKALAEAAKVFTDSGIPVNTILKEGHPTESIIRQATEGKYDMVVMGSRGLGGLKKAFLGSVSQAVLQQVDTSVLVVK